MTLEVWLASFSASELHRSFCELPARKLHLLTAAFLRRVWDDLPSEHTRTAVVGTEKFADGRITACELARLRSTDVLESGEGLWLGPDDTIRVDALIGVVWWVCPYCEQPPDSEWECHAVNTGAPLPDVHSAVNDPAWGAVRAALHARETAAWRAECERRATADEEESRAQFDLLREIAGPDWTDPRWPRWRTTDVRALARGIHRDQAFDRLPILADALQDAGCDDEDVLNHCRRPGGHVRGCWVVDLALGIG